MASAGPNSPTSGTDDSSVGTAAWSNPENILSSNNAMATTGTVALGTTTHYLVATGFGFAIPAEAAINGIVVEVERSKTGLGSVRDSRLRLIKGGVIQAADKAATGTNWPTSDAYATYGGAADLWSGTWTDSDINAADFGVALSAVTLGDTANARVDHVRITVYYTEAAGASYGVAAMMGVG